MNELKNRGVEDVLIAVVDGLKGFPEAITAVFPQATVQTCIVHLLRHSLDFASWKDRKPVAAALKGIYRAVDAAAGEAALSAFQESFWGQKYPATGRAGGAPGARLPLLHCRRSCQSVGERSPRRSTGPARRLPDAARLRRARRTGLPVIRPDRRPTALPPDQPAL